MKAIPHLQLRYWKRVGRQWSAVGFIRRRIVKSRARISLWETVGMATKRTKADKAQRQADQLEKKSERRPEQVTSTRKVRKDLSRAA